MSLTAGAELTTTSKGKGWLKSVHYWASALLALALLPLLARLHLPMKFDWKGLLFGYWVVLSIKSIIAASLLYLIEFASGENLTAALQRVRQHKERIVLGLAYFLILSWLLNWASALLLTLYSVAILELRGKVTSHAILTAARAILPSAMYLFAGLLLVAAYNDIILSVRYFAGYDAAFNSMDKWLLAGHQVSQISHWAVNHLSISFFHFLEFVYYGMFAVVGAGLIIVGQQDGLSRGLQFVGSILTAYFLTLGLFYIWPSQGPFYLCPDHFSSFPASLATYGLQKGSISGAQALWNRQPLSHITFAYYIAFPSMHIVQPLIVVWFLRFRKRITIVLSMYTAVLLVAIVLLEWHYIIDILAGVAVAASAVASVDGWTLYRRRDMAVGKGALTSQGTVS